VANEGLEAGRVRGNLGRYWLGGTKWAGLFWIKFRLGRGREGRPFRPSL